MDLVVFENNKPYVIHKFCEGRFDYVELASDVAETKFFQFPFDKGIVQKLARHYLSPRQRHHVPLWMYVSSQLSLRIARLAQLSQSCFCCIATGRQSGSSWQVCGSCEPIKPKAPRCGNWSTRLSTPWGVT